MKKSLAQLKRDAASGKIRFEMTEWHGKTGTDIPECLQGIRMVRKVNTVAITLLSGTDGESELYFPAASLVSYDGDSLVIYGPAERPLTEIEERAWEEIQDLYNNSPADDSIWKIKDRKEEIAREAGCPWIHASKKIQGQYHDYSGNIIRDDRVCGDVVLRYKIHWVDGYPWNLSKNS